MTTRIDPEHANVLLDALTAQRARLDKDEPWNDYEDDNGDDPKGTREGYVRLRDEAQAFLEEMLNRSRDAVLDPS